eukprot:scaffold395029_cov45-Prasinocladus_malaysianus.AAC.2
MAVPQHTLQTTPVAFNLDVNPPAVAPEFKVTENSAEFEVKADMQGGENVRLGVTSDRVVHIVAEKKPDSTGQADDYGQTTSQRAVPLPPSVDETKVVASYKDGELKMKLPKKDDEATSGN